MLSRNNLIGILTRDMNIVSSLLTAVIIKNRSRLGRRRIRRFGVNPINRNRQSLGFYENLVAEMRLNDNETFINFHRMTPAAFDELLSIVGPSIERLCVGQRSISSGQRLSLTLR